MPNLFPESMNFEENNTTEVLQEPFEFKGSYLFDFEKGDFVKNPDGTVAKCSDLEAYMQWCSKAMESPRYKLIYSDLYGHDFKELIGTTLSHSAIELEIKRMTQETLMVNPRTKSVDNFVFNWSDAAGEVFYTYEVTTVDEKLFKLNKTVKVG